MQASILGACSKSVCICRRQIQLQSAGRVPIRAVLHTISQRGGWQAYYRGFLPNAIKNLPNKGEPPYCLPDCHAAFSIIWQNAHAQDMSASSVLHVQAHGGQQEL